MLTQQSKRLFELVENLLDLSRLEADSIRVSPVEIDVATHLREIVEAVCERVDDVRLDVPPGLTALVDAQAFDRILSNLIANAVRHGAPPFFVNAAAAHAELVVTIEDRGNGVAKEFVGSLFERFTRGQTPSSEGAGLGLSIAQSYARSHGGTLTYEPATPRGARFRLTLPIADAA
jgi:two-component system sensor histidine kinase MtrB